jgi:hypothetical protein
LVFPPQLLLYMALAPEEKLLYDKGGPNAAAVFEAGVEGFKTRQYRGMGVVTSDPVRRVAILFRSVLRTALQPLADSDSSLRRPQFEITDDSEAVQMLQRSTQVGEFYVMGPPV